MSRSRSLILAATVSALGASVAHANWTATGQFKYVDRAYDQTGFTGSEPQLSVRFADVEIMDSRNRLLASGATDASGSFSINVVDSSTRTVFARIVSRSTRTPGLFIDVRTSTANKVTYYIVKGNNVSNHNPNVNVNFGTITALKGQGGEAFNLFDQMVRGADYVAALTGSRPTASLSTVWKIDRGVTDSSYIRSIRMISLRDTAGYDDTVVLHEMGHFFVSQYSDTDSPDTAHTFSNCNEDIRLAYEEGYATYWGNSSLRHAGLAGSHIYMRSNGGPAGPGSLVRYADLETDTQYLCQGATSETNIMMALWDINDGPSTPDGTPGVDDAHDLIALPDTEVSQVQRDYIPTAVNISAEDFWDGWFILGNGSLAAMQAIFLDRVIEYIEDDAEVNNSAATATPLTVGAAPLGATFFYDQDGNGAGAADTDYYVFSALGGQSYTAQTTGLLSDGNTLLEILSTDGSTVLASNNDRVAGDDSSLVVWTAPAGGAYFVRVTHAPDFGIYGSYGVSVTAP